MRKERKPISKLAAAAIALTLIICSAAVLGYMGIIPEGDSDYAYILTATAYDPPSPPPQQQPGGSSESDSGDSPEVTPNPRWDNVYTKGSGTSLVCKIQKQYEDFRYIIINGKQGTEGDEFNSFSGSTVITLLSSHLETMPTGEHELIVSFRGLELELKFYVVDPVVDPPETTLNPATGCQQ